MVDFAYARPTTVEQATHMLSEPEAKALAGGQSLIPALKQRLARPRLLVDVQDLAEMRGIEITDTHVRIGAFTRHAEVADDPRIAADDFFVALFETALAPAELILQIEFPRHRRSGYCKIAHPASGLVDTGVWITRSSDAVRVAVNGASPCVFRHAELERRLAVRFDPASLEGFEQPATGLNDDMHASAGYRAHLVAVAARRALAMALRY